MKGKKSLFLKSILSLIFVIFLGILIVIRSNKSKISCKSISGVVTYIGRDNEYSLSNNEKKFRYLQVDNFPKVFELFVGKSSGDFKPEFEKIDDLKIGDSITLFFDENFKTQSDPINRLVYFIDRGQDVIFIKGSFEKYTGYFIICFCLVFMFILIILKKTRKIA